MFSFSATHMIQILLSSSTLQPPTLRHHSQQLSTKAETIRLEGDMEMVLCLKKGNFPDFDCFCIPVYPKNGRSIICRGYMLVQTYLEQGSEEMEGHRRGIKWCNLQKGHKYLWKRFLEIQVKNSEGRHQLKYSSSPIENMTTQANPRKAMMY